MLDSLWDNAVVFLSSSHYLHIMLTAVEFVANLVLEISEITVLSITLTVESKATISQIPWPTKGPTLLPLLDCTRSLKKGKAVSDLENLIPDEFFPLSGRNVSPTGSLKLAYIKLRQKGLRSYFSMKSMLRYLPDSPWWKDTHDVFHRIRKPNLTPVRKNRC